MKYFLLALSMAIALVGQLLLKKGVTDSSLAFNLPSVIKTIFTPFVFFGLFSYGLSAIVWLFVLQRFPLSTAYPALSLTYVVIIILSFFIFNEPVSLSKIAGVIFIIAGVYFLFR